jgi:hypothetical protein
MRHNSYQVALALPVAASLTTSICSQLRSPAGVHAAAAYCAYDHFNNATSMHVGMQVCMSTVGVALLTATSPFHSSLQKLLCRHPHFNNPGHVMYFAVVQVCMSTTGEALCSWLSPTACQAARSRAFHSGTCWLAQHQVSVRKDEGQEAAVRGARSSSSSSKVSVHIKEREELLLLLQQQQQQKGTCTANAGPAGRLSIR